MKICPTCNQTYSDQSLNFCLADGAVLNPVSTQEMSQPTVLMGQPPITNQNTPTFSNQKNPNQTWGTTQMSSPRPPRKSKAWLWILGILAVVVVVGGIGLIGIIALVATNIDEPTNNNSTKTPDKTPVKKADSLLKDDFSKWETGSNGDGTAEYRNGEFIASTKQINYYVVQVTGDKDFKTWNATTTVTVRNVNGTPTNLGYGILIHSDSKVALAKDYAFLVDSTKQSYRIAQHQTNKETNLINWTKFPALRSGTQTNELQVKDENGKMTFFINGQFATSVNDSHNFKDGVTGIYVSDAVPIAFSNLQLGK